MDKIIGLSREELDQTLKSLGYASKGITQVVKETEGAIFIDGLKVDNVIKDSIKVKPLAENAVEVTMTFLAKDYLFIQESSE